MTEAGVPLIGVVSAALAVVALTGAGLTGAEDV